MLKRKNQFWEELTKNPEDNGWKPFPPFIKDSTDPVAKTKLFVRHFEEQILLGVEGREDVELIEDQDNPILSGQVGINIEAYIDDEDFGTRNADLRFSHFGIDLCDGGVDTQLPTSQKDLIIGHRSAD